MATTRPTTTTNTTNRTGVSSTSGVDRERAIEALVLAFSADPVIRWVYPDPARYLEHFPTLVELMGGSAFEAGSAECSPDYAGTALWAPPGAGPDDEGMAGLLERSIAAERQEEMYAFLGQVEAAHPTSEHWFLAFLGVDPRCQGEGLGSALLASGLARCDREHRPAYLQASSAENRRLYERHGFVATGEVRTPSSPPLWPMWREAR